MGSVAIIGAGIIGMATARALQRQGHQVTVFDPEPPGSGCSFGNAGISRSITSGRWPGSTCC